VRHTHTRPDGKAVALSGKLFRRLLAAYPKAHRRDYGPAMAQLFRDQCRDAWGRGRGWGLIRLWLRVVPDLVKTSVLEHISTIKERKVMLERISTLLRPRSAPVFVFLAVFAVVFLLVVVTSTLITFLLPESYASTARILMRQNANEATRMSGMPASPMSYDPYLIQREFPIIQSQAVLGKVIDDLDLNQAWGKKYTGSGPLKTPETLALLNARIELRPIRNTSLIEIRAFSDQPAEAAQLANAIAQSYRVYRSHILSADIVDTAVPGLRPVRPNKPMNIVLGIAGGILLGLASGTGMSGLAVWIRRRSGGTGTRSGTGTVPPPGLPAVDGGRPRSTLDKVTGILWMGIGGGLFGLTLIALVWFLIFHQASVTSELLLLPLFAFYWGANAVLGFLHSRGQRWARITLGVEGVLLLTYYYFRYWFPLHHCPAWVSMVILRLGSFTVGPMPYMLRWIFIALGLASVCALFRPHKKGAANPC
jgi:capsular polysaccharide biosynthesis protein